MLTSQLHDPTRQRKRRQDRLGYLVVALVGLTATVVAAAFLYAKAHEAGVDRQTLCPQAGPNGVTAIVLDLTDPLNPVQRESVRIHLEQLKHVVTKGERLQVFPVGAVTTDVVRPSFDLCNPGDGSDASYVNQNPKLLKERWEREFSERLDAELDGMLSLPSSATSPIMETIQSVAVTAFSSLSDSLPKRLVLISDMLQNTAGFSQYHRHVTFDEFRKSAYFAKVACDLKGAQVTLYYLNRSGAEPTQGREHILFWQEHISAINGHLVGVTRIEG